MNVPRLLWICALALMFAACSPREQPSRIVLGFSQLGVQNAWRVANTQSIRSAAATSNIDLRFSDGQEQQQNQIAAIRQFIADRVDVIALAPVVETGWDEVLGEAKAAGIPVIVTDRVVTSDPTLYAGFLGSDYVEEGRKAARWIAQQFVDPAQPVNIVQLEGTAGSAPAEDRRKGFQEIVAAHPHLRIVRSLRGDFSRASGERAMAEALNADKGSIHVVFAHNDDMALGAIAAIEAAGLRPGKDIRIVSIDAVRAAFDALIAGKLNATVECNPLLGPQLMTSVTEVVSGRPIPRALFVDEKVFTTENARQYVQTREY